jgi:hypothetical protein
MLGLGKGDGLKCPEKTTPSNRSSAGYGYKTIIRFIKNLKLAPIPAWGRMARVVQIYIP